jgi:hypothetical protein
MLVEHSFLSTNPEAFCRISSFAAWREVQDLTPGYDYLDRLLASSSGETPARRARGRWIPRPVPSRHMERCSRLPDARIVWPTASRPVHSLAREPDLQPAVLASDRVDPIDVGEWSEVPARDRRCMDVREAHEDRFLDLRTRIGGDPLAQAAGSTPSPGSLGEDVAARCALGVGDARESAPPPLHAQADSASTSRAAPRFRALPRGASSRTDHRASDPRRTARPSNRFAASASLGRIFCFLQGKWPPQAKCHGDRFSRPAAGSPRNAARGRSRAFRPRSARRRSPPGGRCAPACRSRASPARRPRAGPPPARRRAAGPGTCARSGAGASRPGRSPGQALDWSTLGPVPELGFWGRRPARRRADRSRPARRARG